MNQVRRQWSLLGLVMMVILVCAWLAGCATTSPSTAPGSSTPASVDVTGTWRGTYRNVPGPVPIGDVTLVLQQTDAKLTGNYSAEGDLDGVIQGNRITYTLRSGRGGGELTVTGDTMSGYGETLTAYSHGRAKLDFKRER
jgi:hypothetical protein